MSTPPYHRLYGKLIHIHTETHTHRDTHTHIYYIPNIYFSFTYYNFFFFSCYLSPLYHRLLLEDEKRRRTIVEKNVPLYL